MALLVTAGCSSPSGPGGGAPNDAAGEIKIGVVATLSGDGADYGVSIKRGLETARDRINGAGGINGRTVKGVYITWYGGEPLLAKEIIFDLTQKIIAVTNENKVNYSAGMISNGYLLAEDPDLAQKLKDSRINFSKSPSTGRRKCTTAAGC